MLPPVYIALPDSAPFSLAFSFKPFFVRSSAIIIISGINSIIL